MKLSNTLRPARFALAAALTGALTPAIDAGDVLLVPGDANTIQAAVDLAAPGDVVLIDAHDYVPPTYFQEIVTIVGKGLTLIAYRGSAPLRSVRIVGVPADEVAVLRGLEVVEPLIGPRGTTPAVDALDLRDCRGPVWVEDCLLQGSPGPGIPCTEPTCEGDDDSGSLDGGDGVVIEDCTSVVFNRCRMIGGPEDWTASSVGNGGDGLELQSSNVAVYDSHLQGASDSHGARVGEGGVLHVAGSVLTVASPQWSQGSALLQTGATASTTTRDNVYVSGPNQPELNLLAGSYRDYPEAYRGFFVRSPVGPDGRITFELDLGREERALVLASTRPGFLHRPELQGVELLGTPRRALDVGFGASARWARAPLVLERPSITLFLQPVVLSSHGALLGPGSVATLVRR